MRTGVPRARAPREREGCSWNARARPARTFDSATLILVASQSVLRVVPTSAAISGQWLAVDPDLVFDRPDRKTFGDDPLSEVLLEPSVRASREGPCVSGRQLTVSDSPLDSGRELQQAERVGHAVRLRPTRVATCSWV